MTKKISIVVPACNEEGNIPILVDALEEVMGPMNYEYQLIFVDDGSSDGTLALLKAILARELFHPSLCELGRTLLLYHLQPCVAI